MVGRAARNIGGEVVMYADSMTDSMRAAIEETNRRRAIQEDYNREHGIEPQTIIKGIRDLNDQLRSVAETQADYGAVGSDMIAGQRGERLAELDRHREDSFALVAHKLRQTAARITSVTGAIASRDVDGIVTEARIALDHQARELQRMAEDVLDVNVLEAKRFRLNLSEVDLTELVTDVAREIGRGQVQLVLQAEPVVVEADADRLRLMVTHLIGNAVKYSPAGSPILVTVASGHAEARIVVEDHGVGFGRSDLTVLFQKYGQAQTAKTTGAQGVGLGLYVTRLIAEAHGGHVSAESVGPGQGSTFQLSLPVRQPHWDRGAAS
jgi:signal transduction histidine kinase